MFCRIGGRFADNHDNFQRVWREIFIEYGADIILGCHAHSVQPVKIQKYQGRKTYTLYSPGNYANIFREYNGDASVMAEIYIENKTKKILGRAIILMWTQLTLYGNYRALPIYEIENLRRKSTH